LNNCKAAWIKEVYKGYLRLVILMLLTKKSIHGYGIIKEIEAKTLGFWKPTPGGLYPLLKRMEKKGEIQSKWLKINKRKRKIYQITVNGERKLRNALKKQKMMAETLNRLFMEFLTNILEVKPPLKLKQLRLFQNVFSLENLKPKTIKEKKRILLNLKVKIEEHVEAAQEILRIINKKLTKLHRV
jgi:DNA-binding PadR family transcriptional regulator